MDTVLKLHIFHYIFSEKNNVGVRNDSPVSLRVRVCTGRSSQAGASSDRSFGTGSSKKAPSTPGLAWRGLLLSAGKPGGQSQGHALWTGMDDQQFKRSPWIHRACSEVKGAKR